MIGWMFRCCSKSMRPVVFGTDAISLIRIILCVNENGQTGDYVTPVDGVRESCLRKSQKVNFDSRQVCRVMTLHTAFILIYIYLPKYTATLATIVNHKPCTSQIEANKWTPFFRIHPFTMTSYERTLKRKAGINMCSCMLYISAMFVSQVGAFLQRSILYLNWT